MKRYTIALLFTLNIFAGEYYAKVEPIHIYEIKSATQGEVVLARSELEGSIVKNEILVEIDNELDKKNIAHLQNTIKILEERIKHEEEISDLRSKTYEKIRELSTKPDVQKDEQLIAALNAKISLGRQKEQLIQIKTNLDELKKRVEQKSIKGENLYVYKIFPSKGDYLRAGDPVATLMDTSGAKAVFFITKEDAQNLKEKKIYLDNKLFLGTIKKEYIIADSTNVSSYKIELELPAPNRFSELIKIEIKDR